MNITTIESLAEFLVQYKSKSVVLTFHSIGDTDSVASAVVLGSYFPNSTIVTPNVVTHHAQRLLQRTGYSNAVKKSITKAPDLFIVLDANGTDALEELRGTVERSSSPKLFIDHHAFPKKMARNSSAFIDEAYNSTSSIVYELAGAMGRALERSEAELLLYGIISDSADFKNADSRTFDQVSKLLEIAKMSYQDIQKNLSEITPADVRIKALNDLFNSRVEVVHDYVIIYGNATTHANAVADRAISAGADAAVFLAITPKEVSISARLRATLDKERSIHLGKLMQDVAQLINGTGGGHPCAAGAYGTNKENGQKALNKVVAAIKQKLR